MLEQMLAYALANPDKLFNINDTNTCFVCQCFKTVMFDYHCMLGRRVPKAYGDWCERRCRDQDEVWVDGFTISVLLRSIM